MKQSAGRDQRQVMRTVKEGLVPVAQRRARKEYSCEAPWKHKLYPPLCQ